MSLNDGSPPLDAQDPAALAAQARLGARDLRTLLAALRESRRIVSAAGGRRAARLSAALQVSGAALLIVQLLLVRAVLEALVGDEAEVGGRVISLMVGLALSVGASQAVTGLAELQQRVLGEQVLRHVWHSLLRVSASVPLERTEEHDFHERLERVRTFALVRPLEISAALGAILSAGLSSVALVAVLLVVEPLLVPVLLAAALPVILLARSTSRSDYRFAVAQTLNLRRRLYFSGLLTEASHAKEIRAFDLGRELLDRHRHLHDQHVEATRVHAVRQARSTLAGTAVGVLALSAALVLVVFLVRAGRLDVQGAVVAALVLRLLAARLQSLASGIGKLFGASLFLEDLIDFLDGAGPTAARDEQVPGAGISVQAEQVSFTYPGADDPALVDVDLALPAGQTTAVVGANGSGKTTLAKIVAGLYQPSAGELRWSVDGEPVRQEQVGANTTVLFQDFVRYELSVRDNVTLGRIGHAPDDDRVQAALRSAGAGDLIAALPHGLDTVLSRSYPGGVELSGGEWQRIALARCFYREAPLIVLDEPTAAMDAKAEFALFSDLRTLLAGRTVLLISHRFSNVRHADRIHVMAHGRIIESGDHAALMARNGTYADLYRMQARAYGLAGEN